MSYISISQFGSGGSKATDPLSYCAVNGLESSFSHTLGASASLIGPTSENCQRYMGAYCAKNWDGVCEYVYHNTNRMIPNQVAGCSTNIGGPCNGSGLGNQSTYGQLLLRNTASEKYLKGMSSNCVQQFFPFDPTVADSPLISKWVSKQSVGDGDCGIGCGSNVCVPYYGVDPVTIDSDPVMNKILEQPWIAMDILVNIYNNAVSSGQLDSLRGTKIHNFFSSPVFQKIVKKRVIDGAMD